MIGVIERRAAVKSSPVDLPQAPGSGGADQVLHNLQHYICSICYSIMLRLPSLTLQAKSSDQIGFTYRDSGVRRLRSRRCILRGLQDEETLIFLSYPLPRKKSFSLPISSPLLSSLPFLPPTLGRLNISRM